MSEIHEVHARLIADSTGNPAIEAEVVLKSGIIGMASCPACDGVSAGDIHDVLNSIAPELEGLDIIDQMELDRSIREAAGDADNSTLFAVSLACARAAAEFLELPLFRYLGGVRSCILPVPLYAISASDGTFLLCPEGTGSFRNAFRKGMAAQRVTETSSPEILAQAGIPAQDARLLTEVPGAAVDPVMCKTLTGVLAAVEKIHRSGEQVVFRQNGSTGDDFLADLAVAVNAAFIEPGTAAQIPVSNRLLRIEEMLGDLAEFGA